MKNAPHRERWRLPIIVILVGLGAAVGFTRSSSSTLGSTTVGGLIGFLVASRFAEFVSPSNATRGLARAFPSAAFGLALASSAWIAIILIWSWVFTRPQGTFHDQGGMLISFFILPLTAFCWLIGGPTASASGRHALKQLHAGTRPETDRTLARRAIVLSQALTLAFAVGVLWLVTR